MEMFAWCSSDSVALKFIAVRDQYCTSVVVVEIGLVVVVVVEGGRVVVVVVEGGRVVVVVVEGGLVVDTCYHVSSLSVSLTMERTNSFNKIPFSLGCTLYREVLAAELLCNRIILNKRNKLAIDPTATHISSPGLKCLDR